MLRRTAAQEETRLHALEELVREEDDLDVLAALDVDSLRLEDLPPRLKDDFLRQVRDGSLAKLIEPWQAWWEVRSLRLDALLEEDAWRALTPVSPRGKIEEVGEEEEVAGSGEGVQGERVPALEELLGAGREASPQVRHDVACLAFAYAFTLRVYNGDWDGSAKEAMGLIVGLCAPLVSATSYADVESAVAASMEAAMRPAVKQSLEAALMALRDAAQIFFAKSSVVRMCGELRALFGRTRKLKAARRKLTFYSSWAHAVDESVLVAEARKLRTAWQERHEALG